MSTSAACHGASVGVAVEVPSYPRALQWYTVRCKTVPYYLMYLITVLHSEIWPAVLSQVARPITASCGPAVTAPTRLAVVASHVLTSPQRRSDSDRFSNTLRPVNTTFARTQQCFTVAHHLGTVRRYHPGLCTEAFTEALLWPCETTYSPPHAHHNPSISLHTTSIELLPIIPHHAPRWLQDSRPSSPFPLYANPHRPAPSQVLTLTGPGNRLPSRHSVLRPFPEIPHLDGRRDICSCSRPELAVWSRRSRIR